jgi:hypothetical protein
VAADHLVDDLTAGEDVGDRVADQLRDAQLALGGRA